MTIEEIDTENHTKDMIKLIIITMIRRENHTFSTTFEELETFIKEANERNSQLFGFREGETIKAEVTRALSELESEAIIEEIDSKYRGSFYLINPLFNGNYYIREALKSNYGSKLSKAMLEMLQNE